MAVVTMFSHGDIINRLSVLTLIVWMSQWSVTAWAVEPSGPPLGRPTSPAGVSPIEATEPQSAATVEAVTLEGPSLGDAPTWTETLRAVLLTAIPDKYEDRKHWGKTTKVFDGFKVRQHGIDMQVSKRTKLVNHGSWYMYQVQLLDPQRNLQLVINHFESRGPGRFSFELHVTAKMRCIARFEQWMLGVKGLNFPVVSDAVVQMHAQCELAMRTERQEKSFLPDVILAPSLQRVRLNLRDIDTHRVGEIRGDLAEELGNGSRRFIEDLLQKQEPKVVKKANAAIAKKRDALRVPASKLW